MNDIHIFRAQLVVKNCMYGLYVERVTSKTNYQDNNILEKL